MLVRCSPGEGSRRHPLAERCQPLGRVTGDDSWDDYCFVVVRRARPRAVDQESEPIILFDIVLKNEYLLKACRDVMGTMCGAVSWELDSVTVRFLS